MCRLRRKVDVCVDFFSLPLSFLSPRPPPSPSPRSSLIQARRLSPLFSPSSLLSPLASFFFFKLIRPFFRGCELASRSCSGYSAAPTQRGGLRRWQAQDDHNPNTHIGTHRGGGRQKKNTRKKIRKIITVKKKGGRRATIRLRVVGGKK